MVTSKEILAFQGSGGAPFTEFIDALIRAQAFVSGLPYSNIHTNLRTTIPDGGVDTRVDLGIQNEPTGWMQTKTIWQYKASEYKSFTASKLRTEITHKYVKNCITDGYAYRLCICDSMPPKTKEEWIGELNQEVQAINRSAPPPTVIDAEDLSAWLAHFPSLILRYFRQNLSGLALHLHAWKRNALAATPTFVPVPEWEPIRDNLRKHSDLSYPPMDVVLSIQGNAGVGKTRIAYESLAGISGAENLVIYTHDDTAAIQIAVELANDNKAFAILVADECPLESRVKLNSLLQGHRDRIRVIVIDNAGERGFFGSPEYWVETISEEIMSKILAENFPSVSVDRRSAYARLSGGFVRLAADLCRNDSQIAASGQLPFTLTNIHDYYFARLDQNERRVVEAIALVIRVGFREDVSDELRALCGLLKLDSDEVRSVAKRLHDVPGFIGMGGRFFYVTPEIIAQHAFNSAWERWVKDSPEEFLSRIPGQLMDVFVKRVSESGREEVRRLVGDFFWQWSQDLTASNLTLLEDVKRLISIVETDPRKFLPVIRRLIERASNEELISIKGDWAGGGWGPRRYLVWLHERLAAFSEHFDDVEATLFKLALAESEPSIGNNATAIWKQVFRISLSGTAVPFPSRIEKLRERCLAMDDNAAFLALDALGEIVKVRAVRMGGPALVAGRIPPPEWRPKTSQEAKECYDKAVSLLETLTTHERHLLRQKAQEITARNLRGLLRSHYLVNLKRMFGENVSDGTRLQLITGIEEYLHYDCKSDMSIPSSEQKYIEEVKTWSESLRSSDTHGRLIQLVGIDPWYHSVMRDEESWWADLETLAQEFVDNPEILKQELPWLCSENARSASTFGYHMGRLDRDAGVLEIIIDASWDSPALGWGYVTGILESSSNYSARLNGILDEVEKNNPVLAYELAKAGGDALYAFERTIRLIDEGKLSATYLQAFTLGVKSRPLEEGEFEEALKRLAGAIKNDDRAWKTAIHLVEFRIGKEKDISNHWLTRNSAIAMLLWQVLEHAPKLSNDTYHWGRVLESLIPVDPQRVAQIAAKALVAEGILFREETDRLLTTLASSCPEIVMTEVGKVMLDETKGWLFDVEGYRGLIQALPYTVVVEWLNSNGIRAARRIARHLPKPHLDSNGEPVIEPLTEFVLKTYEDDDTVFSSFCAGVHSMQLYKGDIAAEHDREAAIARKFRDHRLRRIREWAEIEEKSSSYDARWWREQNEERET